MSGTHDLADSFYGTCAGLYDTVATAPVVRPWRERCVGTLGLSLGDTVIDMGCGTGANFPALRERVGPDGRVVGVDLVGPMLERARHRITRNGWENVYVVQGDATRPPVEEADALVATFVVGMFEEPGRAVRSWVRSVRPGGRVALLNAERTDRLVYRPLNLGFRAFTRLTAPGYRGRLRSPTRELERRWDESVDALFEGTVDHVEERFGLGLVVLASGRVPDQR